MNTLYQPALLYNSGAFRSNAKLAVSDRGRVMPDDAPASPASASLPSKAILPGFVNAHSHSFQRLIRGKSESRVTSGNDFWSWRATMYHAAASLTPEDVYDVARMTFLEMVKAGTTTVGEFHYLHKAPGSQTYDDPNLLAKQVIAAAQSVGIRIVLLRTAYQRSGYKLACDPGQIRFFESAAEFCDNTAALLNAYAAHPGEVSVGVALHSIRALPLDALHEVAAFARERCLPVHMHVAEQLAENQACLREHGVTPVALLYREKLLGPDFTAIHAIHITDVEIAMLADASARICSCPTTERNLGDGILAADKVMRAGIDITLGSDSQAQIDPLEDARQLDYHLRLAHQQRAILDQIPHGIEPQPLAARLFDCATVNGARALQLATGTLAPGSLADFITVDLDDPSIAGLTSGDLLPMVTFSLGRSAIKDVFVNGRQIVFDGEHPIEHEIVARYKAVHQRVWAP